MIENKKTFMQHLIEGGYPTDEIDHHKMDLYIADTPLTTRIIQDWCDEWGYHPSLFAEKFIDQATGKAMYEMAFCYEKDWKEKYCQAEQGLEREM